MVLSFSILTVLGLVCPFQFSTFFFKDKTTLTLKEASIAKTF